MIWNQGRDDITALLAQKHLQRVPPNRVHADQLLSQSRRHVASATSILESDPEGSYALLYDAARKALWAVLENQGLRPTTAGGHIAASQAVRAQLDPPLGRQLQPFDRMRRSRNDAQYPHTDTPELTQEDVRDDIDKVTAILDVAARVMDEMPPF